MTNKKNSKRIKMDKYETEEQVELKQFIKILVVLIILVVGVYFLTRAFVTKDLFNKKEESSETTKGTINYSTTLIGNMFNKIDKEYYVLMYDTEDLQAAYYSGFMSNYSKNKDNDDFINIYFANLNNPLNHKYVTDNEEEININTTNFDEFKVGKLALIKVTDGKISKAITNAEEIAKELEYKEKETDNK